MFNSEYNHNLPDVNRFVKTNWNGLLHTQIQDPTVLCFKFMIDWNSNFGLFDTTGNRNSALQYLIRTGESNRAEYLLKFIENFKRLLIEEPWFIQTIEGLPDIWERSFIDFKINEPKKISIGTLETIDQRVTNLIDLYRKACFDWNLKKEVVPINLRQFSCMIYVFESRGFKLQNYKNDVTKASEFKKIFGYDSEFGLSDDLGPGFTTTRQLFKLDFCEFDFNSGKQLFSNVSNQNSEFASQLIDFTYKKNQEENVYNLWNDYSISDNPILKLDKSIFTELTTLDARLNSSGVNGKLDEIKNQNSPKNDKNIDTRKEFDKILNGSLNFLGVKNNITQQLDSGAAKRVLSDISKQLTSSIIGKIINENLSLLGSNLSTNNNIKNLSNSKIETSVINKIDKINDKIETSVINKIDKVSDKIKPRKTFKEIILQKEKSIKIKPIKISENIDISTKLKLKKIQEVIINGSSINNKSIELSNIKIKNNLINTEILSPEKIKSDLALIKKIQNSVLIKEFKINKIKAEKIKSNLKENSILQPESIKSFKEKKQKIKEQLNSDINLTQKIESQKIIKKEISDKKIKEQLNSDINLLTKIEIENKSKIELNIEKVSDKLFSDISLLEKIKFEKKIKSENFNKQVFGNIFSNFKEEQNLEKLKPINNSIIEEQDKK